VINQFSAEGLKSMKNKGGFFKVLRMRSVIKTLLLQLQWEHHLWQFSMIFIG